MVLEFLSKKYFNFIFGFVETTGQSDLEKGYLKT
jgi:hypothetical protein